MPRRLDRATRDVARALFLECYQGTGDYQQASRRARISARSGRRWLAELPAAELPADGAPSPTPPTYASSELRFVGRFDELVDLHRRLLAGQRLLSLVGSPGVGKTRLGRYYLDRLATQIVGGAGLFCSLAEASSVDELCQQVADVLGLPLAPEVEGGPVAQLGEAIASRGPTLLLLDNADALDPPAVEVLARWVDVAPALRLLTTRRVRLTLGGAEEIAVRPLPLAGGGAQRPSAAIELFLARMGLAAADEQTLSKVSRIAHRLEGVPLAIELAATRAREIGVDAVLEGPAAPGSGASDEGQLRDAALMEREVERSVARLSDPERATLAQLALFPRGATPAAARAVVAPEGAALDPLIEALVAHSLVQREQGRYTLLEMVREVAERALDEGGLRQGAEVRLMRYYLRFAGEQLASAGPAARRAVAGEMANLRLARRIARDGDAPAEALELLLAMNLVYAKQGPVVDFLAALDETLAASVGRVPTALRARVLACRGRVRRRVGDHRGSRADAEQALSLLGASDGDPVDRARLQRDLGQLCVDTGAYQEALEHLRPATAALKEAGDRPRLAAHVGYLLSEAFERLGHFQDAERAGERAAALAELGAGEDLARALYAQGALLYRRRELNLACQRWERALGLIGELELRSGLAVYTLGNLGIARWELGDHDAARRLHRRAADLARELGMRRVALVLVGYRGIFWHDLGRRAEALSCYDEATAGLEALGERYHHAYFLACRSAARATADIDAAVADAARAGAFYEQLGNPTKLAMFSLIEGVLEVARARRRIDGGTDGGTGGEAVELRERAATRLLAVDAHPQGSHEDELAFARKLLERALAGDTPGDAAHDNAWVVAEDGAALLSPAGERIALGRRRVLRRVLLGLVHERVGAPGAPLSAEALIRIGWPERPEASQEAIKRLHYALVTLRKLGLRGWLKSRRSGYLLDPDVGLSVVSRLAAAERSRAVSAEAAGVAASLSGTIPRSAAGRRLKP